MIYKAQERCLLCTPLLILSLKLSTQTAQSNFHIQIY
jgi:hypothetical protein